jgi:hypothetical protein
MNIPFLKETNVPTFALAASFETLLRMPPNGFEESKEALKFFISKSLLLFISQHCHSIHCKPMTHNEWMNPFL